ncbi:MAG: Putative Holliday junction resolvase [Pelotomaculum thermopropionicum]|uniref:Putative pre-16S rRNA nuclease n=1 Tax=Pelotomaculum thermopropionicum TaxID=110500 RepID=A0A101HV02_9FIRM|nr:MAG: Putative Holliday junction resolvase [Pelotomaculum thermopropionicum]
MRIMALDLGVKKIGIALSDPLGYTAQGLKAMPAKGTVGENIEAIRQIALEYKVEMIVVGLPKNMDGSPGIQAEKAREFAGRLAKVLDLPVEMWDERLTTVASEKLLIEAGMSRARRRRVIDKMSAVLILQGFLDFRVNRNN